MNKIIPYVYYILNLRMGEIIKFLTLFFHFLFFANEIANFCDLFIIDFKYVPLLFLFYEGL